MLVTNVSCEMYWWKSQILKSDSGSAIRDNREGFIMSPTSSSSDFDEKYLRDISSWPNKLRDKMHFVTSVCVKRYFDRHEHMSRSYTSKSRSYKLSRTCAGHEPICREHPTPHQPRPWTQRISQFWTLLFNMICEIYQQSKIFWDMQIQNKNDAKVRFRMSLAYPWKSFVEWSIRTHRKEIVLFHDLVVSTESPFYTFRLSFFGPWVR